MKIHDWKRIIIKATKGANERTYTSMALVAFQPHFKPCIQQLIGDYVGLTIDLPKPYNKEDHSELLRVGNEYGFLVN